MKLTTTGIGVLAIAMSSVGCKAIDKLKDAADGENTSYCEAVCDWAVTCADGNSDLTVAEMKDRCIEATEASDKGCGGAEDNLSLDDSILLNECTADIAEMDCNGLVGTKAQVTGAHPPALTCIAGYGGGSDAIVGALASLPDSAVELADVQTYQTYNAARNAVLESGSEVCLRFEDTICNNLVDCMIDKGGVGVDNDTRGTVVDACLDTVMKNQTQDCIDGERYDSVLPVDYNVARYSAMECMDGWDETVAAEGSCAIFTSAPDAICSGAFSSAEQVEQIWTGLFTFAGDYDVNL